MKRSLLLIVLLVVAVSACGDDDTAGNGGETAELSVVLEDFSFSPDEFSVPAGSTVEVAASNLGGINHSWALVAEGVEFASSDEVDESQIIATTGEVEIGQSGAVSFTAPGAGTYQVVCTVSGHIEVGMTGTLTVTG